MKFKELQNMTDKELNDKLSELHMELIKLNAQVSAGTVPKSPGLIRESKRTIAKIKTALGRRNKKE